MVSGFAVSVRRIQSDKFSKERRTILALLGERAGVRAEVILASLMSWLHPKSPVSRPVHHQDPEEPKKGLYAGQSSIILSAGTEIQRKGKHGASNHGS